MIARTLLICILVRTGNGFSTSNQWSCQEEQSKCTYGAKPKRTTPTTVRFASRPGECPSKRDHQELREKVMKQQSLNEVVETFKIALSNANESLGGRKPKVEAPPAVAQGIFERLVSTLKKSPSGTLDERKVNTMFEDCRNGFSKRSTEKLELVSPKSKSLTSIFYQNTSKVPHTPKSPNKKMISHVDIIKAEVKQSVKCRQEELLELWEEMKAIVASFFERVQNAYEFLNSLRGSVARLIDEVIAFVVSVSTVMQATTYSIAAIPGQVEHTTTKIKSSVEDTVLTTKTVVNEMKALPQRVQETAKATRESAESAFNIIDTLQQKTRALLGDGSVKSDLLPIKPPSTAEPQADPMALLKGAVAGTTKFVKLAVKNAEELRNTRATEEKTFEPRTSSSSTGMEDEVLEALMAAEEALKAANASPEQVNASQTSTQTPPTFLTDVRDFADIEDEIAVALKAAEDELSQVSESLPNPTSEDNM